MKCLVTGAAGFIGSHLSERLLKAGCEVVGLDCFLDYYPQTLKKDNLRIALANENYRFIEGDLNEVALEELLTGTDYVFHQAAQAGVRASWGNNFGAYLHHNIKATQRLLEHAKDYPLKKFVYGSSSSVYGDVDKFPMQESDLPRPASPYGMTKLAAEHLCFLYHKNYHVPVVTLRYFTVYGPRQRPDMAFHKFSKAILKGETIPLYDNGEQTRDFTFYSDIMEANYLAALKGIPGTVYNIGGGSRITVKEVFRLLEEITGKKISVEYLAKQKGDVLHTAADISKAHAELGYTPAVGIKDGLRQEIAWVAEKLASGLL